MKKVCIVVSSEMTVRAFLLDQISALSRIYNVSVVANTGNRDLMRGFGIEAAVLPILIERKISPLRDVSALFRLCRLFQ